MKEVFFGKASFYFFKYWWEAGNNFMLLQTIFWKFETWWQIGRQNWPSFYNIINPNGINKYWNNSLLKQTVSRIIQHYKNLIKKSFSSDEKSVLWGQIFHPHILLKEFRTNEMKSKIRERRHVEANGEILKPKFSPKINVKNVQFICGSISTLQKRSLLRISII